LQALPNLEADPGLEVAAGIGEHHVGTRRDSARGVLKAEVGEQEPGGRQQVPARALREDGNGEPGEPVLEKLVDSEPARFPAPRRGVGLAQDWFGAPG
jgi:hypothetical protein